MSEVDRLSKIKLIYLVRSGLTIKQIAEKLELSEYNVRDRCTRWNLKPTRGQTGRKRTDPLVGLDDEMAEVEFDDE